jgi:hypothetical protein
MKLILFIASAAILGFSGLAAANTPASRIIDTAISTEVVAAVAAKQAHGEQPLRMAPHCPGGCPRNGVEPLRMAPGCPSCTRGGKEPLRMAPNCSSGCGRGGAEPLRVAPTCTGSRCARNRPGDLS